MKRLFALGAISLIFVSCGSTERVAIQTTLTSTTVFLGEDCNSEEHDRIIYLAQDYLDAKDFKANSKSEYLNYISKVRSALLTYRSNVRRLDLPTLVDQQSAVVNTIEDLLNALNRYISTNGKDSTYLDYSIPMADAFQDFSLAYFELCRNR